MISYRIRFSLLCPECHQPDSWDIKGMGQNHADWIKQIAAAGQVEWTCSRCKKKSVCKVLQAEYEQQEVKR